jgi:hypothetical protein
MIYIFSCIISSKYKLFIFTLYYTLTNSYQMQRIEQHLCIALSEFEDLIIYVVVPSEWDDEDENENKLKKKKKKHAHEWARVHRRAWMHTKSKGYTRQ